MILFRYSFGRSPRDSVMNSIRLRESILSDRRPLRDTYCSQRYTDGGDGDDKANHIRPSISQRIIEEHEKSAVELDKRSSSTQNFMVDPLMGSSSPLLPFAKVRLVSRPNNLKCLIHK